MNIGDTVNFPDWVNNGAPFVREGDLAAGDLEEYGVFEWAKPGSFQIPAGFMQIIDQGCRNTRFANTFEIDERGKCRMRNLQTVRSHWVELSQRESEPEDE